MKFVTRKWNIVNDQSNANYDVGNKSIHNTEVLKSNLGDCDDANILGKGDITIVERNPKNEVVFKNCAPFTNCITKIDETSIDDAEDLGIVMPIYNLLECSLNYSETIADLWFYSKDEATNLIADIDHNEIYKSFQYKAKLLGNTKVNENNGILRNEVGSMWRLYYWIFVGLYLYQKQL